MNLDTLTITEEHYEQLKQATFRSDGKEGAAFLLCGRSYIENEIWTEKREERFLSREVYVIPDDEIVSSSTADVTFRHETYLRVLKIAEEKNYAVALVHSHPKGHLYFSKTDDEGEAGLFQLAVNRNGSKRPQLSIIIERDENLLARVWHENRTRPISLIRIIGKRITLHYEGKHTTLSKEEFARQALAFGPALNNDLQRLKVAVIGCGGTGSPTAMLLARLGIGHILLIDDDFVEKTNLNRLHGSSVSDVKNKKPKVKVVENLIHAMELGTIVKTIKGSVESKECQEALKSVDLIFGCTDDHLGRMILNRIAYCYLIPVIDMGLAMKVQENVSPPVLQTLDGRVTYLFPNEVCLLCRKVIDPKKAYAETLRKNNPQEYAKQVKEEYVEGEGNPSPSVVTFTTDLASMAVTELIDRLQGFRGEHSGAAERRRKYITCEERRTGATARPECPVCSNKKYYGRGDMIPFLDISL